MGATPADYFQQDWQLRKQLVAVEFQLCTGILRVADHKITWFSNVWDILGTGQIFVIFLIKIFKLNRIKKHEFKWKHNKVDNVSACLVPTHALIFSWHLYK